ncbi:MAG: amidase family protein [Alphaproteobacteria bacterium]|jgi:aspartyl-tRNA(Asn)/glutamyl-tRNA(Gln) amidotransferase subunit A|nr:amidase family protein [Alphaproteobacteria bacterium]MDP6819277.1 amidase family protein [Alphaproteobacteria bacterium]
MTSEWHDMSALALGDGIGRGEIDANELCEHFLARIERIDTEHDIYLRTTPERARAEAAAAAERARKGLRLSPLDGVPISWKDLFDTAGDVTGHGAKVLQERVAASDATVVARAGRAGLVCLGKTNQTEFAFSILGINPNYGTPANPFDDDVARLPGGSTSGGAVSLARGLAAAAIGSDTGGSVRVPAAWNGLVGLKTSFGLLPLKGVLGLSTSMDTVGPLTRDIADAAALFSALAGRYGAGNSHAPDLAGADAARLGLALPAKLVWENLDAGVERAARGAVARLEAAGVTISEAEIPQFAEIEELISHFGPFHAAECHALWHVYIEARPNLVYRPILERIRLGGKMPASEVEGAKQSIRKVAPALHARIREVGVLAMPTIAISPPAIAELENDMEAWMAANIMTLRNTRLGNFLDCTALTLPCGKDDNGIPVGLMLMAPPRWEERLLRMASAMEPILLK